MQALIINTNLTVEEKRLEVFEILEPQLRNYWTKYKYNQGMILNMTLALFEIEYFTTSLLLKMLGGLFKGNGPAMIDRLIVLFEKMSELDGNLIRQKSS